MSSTESKVDAPKILEITVRPGASQPIRPRSFTLTDSVLIVAWSCDDLPPDAKLQVVFPKDPRGPFFILESTGQEVIGWGNRGPETPQRFPYEVQIVTADGVNPVGSGVLLNRAKQPRPYISYTTTYPPGDPIEDPPKKP